VEGGFRVQIDGRHKAVGTKRSLSDLRPGFNNFTSPRDALRIFKTDSKLHEVVMATWQPHQAYVNCDSHYRNDRHIGAMLAVVLFVTLNPK
jgi:hypothetical protein